MDELKAALLIGELDNEGFYGGLDLTHMQELFKSN